jgi:hypothetical protein
LAGLRLSGGEFIGWRADPYAQTQPHGNFLLMAESARLCIADLVLRRFVVRGSRGSATLRIELWRRRCVAVYCGADALDACRRWLPETFSGLHEGLGGAGALSAVPREGYGGGCFTLQGGIC